MYRPDKEAQTKFYESFGKTEETVTEDIETIKIWLQTQKHHPETMDDAKIRNMLHLCKFNIEKTKERIDNYYTFRTKYPSIFNESNPKLPSLKETMEANWLGFHPKLLDGIHRVVFLKPKEKNTYNAYTSTKLFFSILEIRMQEDFMVDEVILVDMSTFSFRDLCKMSPTLLFNFIQVYRNIFSMRINAAYFINSPSYMSIWIALFKFLLPVKIFKRIQFHKDSEVLKEVFAHDDLPKDYDGNGPSLDQMTELMKRKLVEYQERFDALDKMKVDESLRT